MKKLDVTIALAVAGFIIGPRLMAAPVPDAIATPARPQTPDEQALQARIDPIQTQMAAAVTARRYDDYAGALSRLTTRDCRFFDVSGQSTSRPQFLDAERQSLSAQNPTLTETMHTLTLVITGPTALETAVVTDDEDATDTAGEYGAKGKKHHWERQTSLRLHWADAPDPLRSQKTDKAREGSAWRAQQIAVTDIQTLLDGRPYIPPQPKTSSGSTKSRTNTSRIRTRQPKIRQPRTRRYPYVIPGVRIYRPR